MCEDWECLQLNSANIFFIFQGHCSLNTAGMDPLSLIMASFCVFDLRYLNLLGKVCENESAFLWRKLVLLLSGLLQQLLSHHSKYRAQQRSTEDLRGLVAR